ncbi:MAG: hypothetical protein K2X77_06740 [Candidatus Obscuribacterales bacterium]|nr:hypothetical protein [Candidatus Obscuribacterales bacterium]
MTVPETRANYFPLLLFLLVLFIFRVVCQLLVANFEVSFLPPMNQWQSGLLPYPLLVFFQFLIIAVYGRVCRDFWFGNGYFVQPNAKLAKFLTIFGSVYFVAMILRYIIRMEMFPEARWFDGTLPIFFHLVLASFILTVAKYQRAIISQLTVSRSENA